VLGVKPLRLLLALVYRELVWLRRFPGVILSGIAVSLFFAFAVVGLPASIGNINDVVARISESIGANLTLQEALLVALVSASMLNMVSGVISNVTQTLYFELATEEVISTILASTSIAKYVVALSMVKPLTVTLVLMAYLLIVLVVFQGVLGLVTCFLLLPPLLLSAFCLGFLSAITITALHYYAGIKRPWVVSGIIVPVILAGSGVFMSFELVPWYLRLIAQVTPVPYAVAAARMLIIAKGIEHFKTYMPILAVLYTVYYVLAYSSVKVSERRVKRGW
jgi:hypothetical protein